MIEILWENSFDISGYGKWGRGSVEALINSGIYKIAISPLAGRLDYKDSLAKYQNIDLENPIKVINNIPMNPPIGKRAGFCTCTEIANPPEEQIRHMNQSKFVLALSSYCTNIYKSVLNDPEKVHKVNFPMFRGQYSPRGPRIKWKNIEKKFKFLFVGRIDVRKNIPALIKAFKEEFGRNRNVVLILKIYSPDYNIPLWIKQHNPSNNILWLRERIKDLSILYRSVNAYITTDLGEAWGGPTQEAMISGLPTIAPRHSGHLDYMNDENSYLLDVSDWKVIGYRKKNLYSRLLPPDGLVKYPDINDIRRKLRLVYDTYRGIPKEDILEMPLIKNAMLTQKLVDEETTFKNLSTAIQWIEKNVP